MVLFFVIINAGQEYYYKEVLWMNEERRKIYISALINFLVGIVLGIILFYGQQKVDRGDLTAIYEYDKTVSTTDFFRLSWLNLLWLITIFFARILMPIWFFHPVFFVRGTISSFSMLYIVTLFGKVEAVASLIPQCFSILPLLLYFSVETVLKFKNSCELSTLKRGEIAKLFVFSMIAGATEVLLFEFFCNYLL